MLTRPTDEEMVVKVLTWLSEESPEIQREFKMYQFDRLISYHSSLGRDIRNHFKLWGYAWTPVLQKGIDCSEEHPDAISMRIIKKVWKIANDQ